MLQNLLFSLLLVTTLAEAVPSESSSTKSFMSDKTEVAVNLEVSGAEAICQTDDGYVWIAQYSGLTRYDSHILVSHILLNRNIGPEDQRALLPSLGQDVDVTRETIFNHPELLPPFFVGCRARLIFKEADSALLGEGAKSDWQPLLPSADGKYDLPDWRTLPPNLD